MEIEPHIPVIKRVIAGVGLAATTANRRGAMPIQLAFRPSGDHWGPVG